jgi:8-oxo-dGTP pyrophosphatase MutT (NUDIX family)
MTRGTIRPVAICIFRRAHEILVVEAFDRVKGEIFYRPLGGGIGFGETSAVAVTREIREEVSADVTDLRYVGTLENIFVYNGEPGHEIVQVHEGRFANPVLYAAIELSGVESDGTPFRAIWKSLDSFGSTCPLYPDGLREMLLARIRIEA